MRVAAIASITLSLYWLSGTEGFATPSRAQSRMPSSPVQLQTIDEIHAMVDGNGRKRPPLPLSVFTAMIGLSVPVVLAVLPLSVISMVTKALYSAVFPIESEDLAPIDSGIKVEPEDIKDRSKRTYDVIVFGATGFTGRLAVRYISKTYGVNKNVKWAIAGRSKSKLERVKEDTTKDLNMDEVMNLDTIVVDTSDIQTLPNLVSDTKVVLTTVGPFQKYGSPVVEACAKFGTHYVDITGESDWVKTMLFQWEAVAQKTGAKIISHCGLDCVPSDLTVMKLEESLPSNESLKRASLVGESEGGISGGTISTVLLGVEGNNQERPQYDDDPFLRLPDGTKSSCNTSFQFPMLTKRLTTNGRFKGSYLAFFALAIPNGLTVKRSNALRGKSQDLIYEEGANFADWKSAFAFGLIQVIGGILLINPLTRYFVKKVLPKPGEGPSMDFMVNKSYFCLTGHGEGSKGTRTMTALYFPRDVGYLDTARIVSESAICLAFDQDKLPTTAGGFFTPSTGMGQPLLDRLIKTGSFFAGGIYR